MGEFNGATSGDRRNAGSINIARENDIDQAEALSDCGTDRKPLKHSSGE